MGERHVQESAGCGICPRQIDAVDTATFAEGVKLLDQSWSHDERLEYYYTSPGSAPLRYGIFVAVEQADTQDLFRSDANVARFGFVTRPGPNQQARAERHCKARERDSKRVLQSGLQNEATHRWLSAGAPEEIRTPDPQIRSF